uniref:Uncharacterized protein n=1 Tax=Branchiostoma floridae TaxID=7739 RepID=C3XZL9_BRAFL|eukprot:XP_002610530.1 hypothetical protein BRAFLDRAFT_65697 [Branchiostoma floridae]
MMQCRHPPHTSPRLSVCTCTEAHPAPTQLLRGSTRLSSTPSEIDSGGGSFHRGWETQSSYLWTFALYHIQHTSTTCTPTSWLCTSQLRFRQLLNGPRIRHLRLSQCFSGTKTATDAPGPQPNPSIVFCLHIRGAGGGVVLCVFCLHIGGAGGGVVLCVFCLHIGGAGGGMVSCVFCLHIGGAGGGMMSCSAYTSEVQVAGWCRVLPTHRRCRRRDGVVCVLPTHRRCRWRGGVVFCLHIGGAGGGMVSCSAYTSEVQAAGWCRVNVLLTHRRCRRRDGVVFCMPTHRRTIARRGPSLIPQAREVMRRTTWEPPSLTNPGGTKFRISRAIKLEITATFVRSARDGRAGGSLWAFLFEICRTKSPGAPL